MTGLLQISEPRRGTRALRLTFNPPVVCPAGQPIYESERGSGVRCMIERSTLTATSDPQSISGFCFGDGRGVAPDLPSDYKRCPTWRAQQDWIEQGYRSEVADQATEHDAEKRRKEWEELGVIVERPTEVEVTNYYPED